MGTDQVRFHEEARGIAQEILGQFFLQVAGSGSMIPKLTVHGPSRGRIVDLEHQIEPHLRAELNRAGWNLESFVPLNPERRWVVAVSLDPRCR